MPSAAATRATVTTPGIDRLLTADRQLIAGRRIGLVCNPASIDAGFVTPRIASDDPDVTLSALFGPQHGFRSDLQDNMIETPHAPRLPAARPGLLALQRDARADRRDARAASTCWSIDLQDVGTRIYTYIYTMANCMRAAARHGIRVVVCDRPNPIGGDQVEGARLQRAVDVVRRPVPDPDAARPDDRRAGAAVQR